MNKLTEAIKTFLKNFIEDASKPEPINDISDYRKVKKWIKKVKKLYTVFSIVAVIVALIVTIVMKFVYDISVIPLFFVYVFFQALILLSCWGYATLIMYFPKVIKSVFKSGSAGYKVGSQIETTHVNVTHEYGNTYRVSSYTENKGCLFAVIVGTARFFVWMVFCVYVGPFVTFKKVRASKKNLVEYQVNEQAI